MSENKIDLNIPVFKSESGLYIDQRAIEDNNKKQAKTAAELAYQKYTDRFNKNSNVPVPNIKVPYSYLLTKAVPPKMIGETTSGLLINELEIDIRAAKRLQIMSENVDDMQEVLLVGPFASEGCLAEPGDTIRIDYSRYIKLNDDHTPGVIQKSYEIPLYEIEGNEYLLLDARDVIYVVPGDKENKNKKTK